MYGGNSGYPIQSDPRKLVRVPANDYQYSRQSDQGESYERSDSQHKRSARQTNNAGTPAMNQVPLDTFSSPNISSMPTTTGPMGHSSLPEHSSYLIGVTQRTSPAASIATQDRHAAILQQPRHSMPSSNSTYTTYPTMPSSTAQGNQASRTPEPTLAPPSRRSYGERMGSNREEEPSHSYRKIPAPCPPVITYGTTSLTPVERPSFDGYPHTSISGHAVSSTTHGFEYYEEQPHMQPQGSYQPFLPHQRDDSEYLSPSSQGTTTAESNLMLQCCHCQNKYYGKNCQRSLSRHIETKHSPSSSTTSTDNGEVYQCEACEKQYHRKDAKLKHEREKHPELNRPPKKSRPKTGTKSQRRSTVTVTRHDSRAGLVQSASTDRHENPDDPYGSNNWRDSYQ